ncbi:TolC family protein [Sphingomonas desiccabilis]|uniref:TolC family protein n=1 Tax=Sphingomonas desiccabilis TaxID=429134 RepID=A0A4Q2IP59_9SPHN|nr:TolC family protein [Sphingomonas desiccabilis]MBB3911850.1 cobalt-zinc-cadmium efflux system outer membrane protein [Sphingomonas desiccabilis]RXZ31436.1 TolC family protein [Sphingomonas desiccabilis]
MHRIIAASLAASVCASSAQAQTSPPATAQDGLTLEQALDLAGANAPGIRAADAGVRAAEAQRRVAGQRPNPSVNVEVENVVGTGAYSGIRGAETTVGMSLPLELGGKRSARIAVADTQTARARLAAVTARADLRLRVTQAYNEAVASERRLLIARDQQRIATEGLRAANVRVRAGRASPLEEQRADVVRINADTALAQSERAVTLARANVARLIGRDPAGLDLGWFDRVGARPRLPAGPEGTLALAAAEAEVATANAQVRLARSQRVPDLTLSAGVRRLEATNDVAAVFGVSLPIPLFNNGRAGIDAARAQGEQAEALRRVALLDAQRAIATAETDLAHAEANARAVNGPALAAAQEATRIARIGYREGKFGQLDLLDAERTLAQTRSAAIDALAAYHDAEARLERLTARAHANTEVQP